MFMHIVKLISGASLTAVGATGLYFSVQEDIVEISIISACFLVPGIWLYIQSFFGSNNDNCSDRSIALTIVPIVIVGILLVSGVVLTVVLLKPFGAEFNSGGDEKSNVDGKYRIHSTRDLSYEDVVRSEYRIIVSEEVTQKQLEEITLDLVEKVKKEKPFNAVAVLLYDDKRFIGKESFNPSLGMANYAPDGKWENAGQVKTGDYSTMQLNSEIYEKHWELKPSEEDMQIYDVWLQNRDVYKQETGDEFINIDKYSKYLANKLGLTESEIIERYNNASNWQNEILPEGYNKD